MYNLFSTDAPELLDAMVEVTKYVGIKNTTFTATSYNTKLFPLAHDEMESHASYVVPDEGSIYTFYQTHTSTNDRIKKAAGSDTSESYWVRSPYDNGNNGPVWYCDSNGSPNNASYADEWYFGVAPAFCI